MELNQVYHMDCLEGMKGIADKSVDMILCDLPYQVTSCSWDILIPFDKLWQQYERIIKPNGAIVLTAREPFTSALVMSNTKRYKHKWVWNKKQSGSFLNAKHMPMQIEEDIMVFAYGKVNYYPIMRTGKMRVKGGAKKDNGMFVDLGSRYKTYNDQYYPTNILEFPNCSNKAENLHPTQKPVALFEYLIKTYTNEGETVLDNCAGSGTTAIACINTNRNYILYEKEEKYYQIIQERIKKHVYQPKLIA
jgi:site-specific DNA-methyltransferase (adenine-specific)